MLSPMLLVVKCLNSTLCSDPGGLSAFKCNHELFNPRLPVSVTLAVSFGSILLLEDVVVVVMRFFVLLHISLTVLGKLTACDARCTLRLTKPAIIGMQQQTTPRYISVMRQIPMSK